LAASPEAAEDGGVFGSGEHATSTLATNAAPMIRTGLHSDDVS
jgi:hypothetical protein